MARIDSAPIATEQEASALDAFMGFVLLAGMAYGIYRGFNYLRRRGADPTEP